jgi:hypothetical protein
VRITVRTALLRLDLQPVLPQPQILGDHRGVPSIGLGF